MYSVRKCIDKYTSRCDILLLGDFDSKVKHVIGGEGIKTPPLRNQLPLPFRIVYSFFPI